MSDTRLVVEAFIDSIIASNGINDITGDEVNDALKAITANFLNLASDKVFIGLKEYIPSGRVYDAGEGTIFNGAIYQANKSTGNKAFDAADWDDISSGSGPGGIAGPYADIPDMLANVGDLQAQQAVEVTDGSADPTVDSGRAFYRYSGSGNTLADFAKLGEEEAFTENLTGPNQDQFTKPGVSNLGTLKAVPTGTVDLGSFITFRDIDSGLLFAYNLISSTEAENLPFLVRPNDYAAATNEKAWQLAEVEAAALGASNTIYYKFETTTIDQDPGNGKIAYNNANVPLVTELFIDDQTRVGSNVSNILDLIDAGSRIYIQKEDDATRYALFTATGPPTVEAGYRGLPVSFDEEGSGGGFFGDGNNIFMLIVFSGSGASLANQDRFTLPLIENEVDLKAVVTSTLGLGTHVTYLDVPSDELRVYKLQAGTDLENTPFIIRPDDYVAVTNEKVWKLVNAVDQTPSILGGNFNFDALTADADPGDGNFRLNNADLTLVNEIYIDNLSNSGNNAAPYIDQLQVNNKIIIQQLNDESKSALYNVEAIAVDATGYRRVSISYVADGGGGVFDDTAECQVQLLLSAGSAGSNVTIEHYRIESDLDTNIGPFGYTGEFDVVRVENYFGFQGAVEFETAIDGASPVFVSHANITALNAWIDANVSGDSDTGTKWLLTFVVNPDQPTGFDFVYQRP